MRVWTLFSTSTVRSYIWMCPLLLPSLATRLWSQQPAPDQDTWPKELRKPKLTDRGHTPENSSATSCEMLRTPRWPSGTPGQPSKVCSTVPSPNNNSQPLRDQSIIAIPRFTCASLVMTHVSTFLTGTHSAFTVSSQPQPSNVALLR